ncbi:MAG: response regulator [Ramlibacter sp.]|nr:response regulator [Ramlibacter sp.]
MTQRVFVQVVGFTDTERHALNTVFRLSEQRDTIYSLWHGGTADRPTLALMDGQSNESRLELEFSNDPKLKVIWVGSAAPPNAWRIFQRPIVWPQVVSAMDQLFAPADDLDFDLDFDNGPDTLPPDEPRPHPAKRALIASASRDERLYLRARLALADLTQADDAETGAQALELARAHPYAVALVDFGLPDVEGWAFLKDLAEAQPAIRHVIVTKDQTTVPERIRAWRAGAEGFFQKPPHPERLHNLLRKV